ncbi:MAG: class I SAM-dependent methyltransferase [Desulfobacteraceae bacterium]
MMAFSQRGKGKFSIIFPKDEPHRRSQSEESCIIEQGGGRRQRIRFHDYRKIYAIPGLYEHLFCEKLRYNSPEVVTGLLVKEVLRSSGAVSDLVVLEIGAGNGLVGEALKRQGVSALVGIDIVPEAAEAAQRDRPGLYVAYYVEDLQNLSPDVQKALKAKRFNCLVAVGALGFSDISPRAFTQAYNLIGVGGWIAFNIKEDFMEEGDSTGFERLIRGMVYDGALELKVRRRYCHRLSMNGRPLHYMAVIGRKKR